MKRATFRDEPTQDEVIELTQALEQLRAVKIAEAVAVTSENLRMDTSYRAGFEAACEEVLYRLRTEQWELCLPPAGTALRAINQEPTP